MKLRLSASRAATSAAICAAIVVIVAPAARVAPARAPKYGGTLRVEIGESIASLDPSVPADSRTEAAAKIQIESLIYQKRNPDDSFSGVAGSGPFRISVWEPGKSLSLAANDDFSGGRAFVDAIEIRMGRGAADRIADIELGRADFVEIPPEEALQTTAHGTRVVRSQQDQLLALVFAAGHSGAIEARLREAIARSMDRSAIVNFILQREGEPAGGLLPQWSSGTAFLFTIAPDPARAKELRAQIGASPEIRLGYDADDVLEQSIAQRIAVDARESGIAIAPVATSPGAPPENADARLIRLSMSSPDPAVALTDFLATLGPLAGVDAALPKSASAEQVYSAERGALEGFRIVPIAWYPRVYGLSARVRDWQMPSTGEPWPFADVWLDTPPAAEKRN